MWAAYTETMKAAEKAGRAHVARARIRTLVASETYGERFVSRTLGEGCWVSDPGEGRSLQVCQRTTTDSSPRRFRVERTVT